MSTQIMTKLTCPSCGNVASGVKPGTRCPMDDGHVLVDAQTLARYPKDPMLGRVLADKYALIGVIGQGGMGSVYVGLHESVGREVAVKVIRNIDGPAAEQLRGRFAREAKVIGRLSHDNLVTLYDYGEDQDGTLYLVMEYLRGQSLGARLRERGAFPAVDAVRVTCQILAAIAEAHELGLVHRDLKPENVLLVPMKDGSERVKVLDFGIAKVIGGGDHTVETRQGLVLGTPRYMSPEQAIGVDIGPRTDLYACGVLLYEMLTGKAPFSGETPFAVLTAHRITPVPPLPSELGVAPALERAVGVALAKEPGERFADAHSMAAALRAAVGLDSNVFMPATKVSDASLGETVALGGSTTAELAGQALARPVAPEPPPKSRRPVVIVGAVAAVGLLVGGYLLSRGAGSSPTEPAAVGVAQPAVIVVGATERPSAPPSARPEAGPPVSVAPAPPTAAMAPTAPTTAAAPPTAARPPAAAVPAPASQWPSASPAPRPKAPAAPGSKPAVRIDEF